MIDHADPSLFHRGVKMALDTGEAKTVEEAYSLFEGYRLAIWTGGVLRRSRAHQAALLTRGETVTTNAPRDWNPGYTELGG